MADQTIELDITLRIRISAPATVQAECHGVRGGYSEKFLNWNDRDLPALVREAIADTPDDELQFEAEPA